MKYYFAEGLEEEGCLRKNDWEDYIKFNEIKEVKLIEAKIEYNTEYFYCSMLHETGLKDEGTCGTICKYYMPRNKVSGRCIHSKNCYTETDKTIILKNKTL